MDNLIKNTKTQFNNVKTKISNKVTPLKIAGTTALMTAIGAGYCDVDVNGSANTVLKWVKNFAIFGGTVALVVELVLFAFALKEMGNDGGGGQGNLKKHIFGIVAAAMVAGIGAVMQAMGIGTSFTII